MIMCNDPTANSSFKSFHELHCSLPLISTKMRSILLEFSKPCFILHHSHGALFEMQELFHHLVPDVSRKILLTKSNEKILPSDHISIPKNSTGCRLPPYMRPLLKCISS